MSIVHDPPRRSSLNRLRQNEDASINSFSETYESQIGHNILLDRLPPDGWIEIIKDGSVRSPSAVRDEWRRFSFLRESTVRSRGWTSDVLRCVRKLGKREFSLQEIYDFEEELGELHPKNRHIRPKIR